MKRRTLKKWKSRVERRERIGRKRHILWRIDRHWNIHMRRQSRYVAALVWKKNTEAFKRQPILREVTELIRDHLVALSAAALAQEAAK